MQMVCGDAHTARSKMNEIKIWRKSNACVQERTCVVPNNICIKKNQKQKMAFFSVSRRRGPPRSSCTWRRITSEQYLEMERVLILFCCAAQMGKCKISNLYEFRSCHWVIRNDGHHKWGNCICILSAMKLMNLFFSLQRGPSIHIRPTHVLYSNHRLVWRKDGRHNHFKLNSIFYFAFFFFRCVVRAIGEWR